MTVETRVVTGFDEVRFGGPGNLRITQSDEESLTIDAPRYVMQGIESHVVDGVLKLGYVNPQVVPLRAHRENIAFELKIKDIRRISLQGSGRILIPDLDNDQLAVVVAGAGEIVLAQLTSDRFEAKISGSGSVRIIGDVELQKIEISGSGSYKAEKLISDVADVKLSGSGQADVSVNDELSAIISGSGFVSYSGFPDIYKQVSGAGKIIRRRKENRNPTRGKEHA